nr:MAG TPA: hypothetical protein [Caudoviricetes sp.]
MSVYDLEALYNVIYKADDMLREVLQHSKDFDKLILPEEGVCFFDALKSFNALVDKMDDLSKTCKSFEDRFKKYII